MIENLYKNCKDLIDKSELYAVFISNDSRKVPIYNQKASKNDDPVVWVIALQMNFNVFNIYRFDLRIIMSLLFIMTKNQNQLMYMT